MGKRLRFARVGFVPTTARPADKSERDKFYAGSKWRRLRFAFLNENPLCQRCHAKGLDVAATIAHHKVERLDDAERSLDWDNLEALCSPCHTLHHKGKGPPE